MERRQQERLVGAIVVVIAAAVVVPWLLDGSPERWAAEGRKGPAIEQPRLQRRTFDLRNPDAAPAEAQPTPTRESLPPSPQPVASPPPGEAAQNAPEQQATKERDQATAPTAAVVAVGQDDVGADDPEPSAPPTVRAAPEPTGEEASGEPLTPAAPEPAPAGVETGWAVQVGSFRKRENAQGLADRLSRKGYRAFLSRHTRSGVVWYRVRVGTEQSRAAAGDVAARLRREGQVTAEVPHP